MYTDFLSKIKSEKCVCVVEENRNKPQNQCGICTQTKLVAKDRQREEKEMWQEEQQ